jgi:hypothetical protein
MTNEEKVFQASPAGTVREAAESAAQEYAADETEKHAQAIMDAWAARMKALNNELGKALAKARDEGVAEAEAEPWTPAWPWPYPWWNILIAGPFQFVPFDAFLPHKIFQPDEAAFVVGAVWMNPFGIGWNPFNPSAATLMGAFDLTIRFETINLTTVADGPDPAPIEMNPIGGWFGPPWFKLFWKSIGSGFFPSPPQGQPHLYEMNVAADVSGPVPEPFAGYSTWVFDPDLEPAMWPPYIRPGTAPHWQYDIPARFLVYRP